jgi:hypothetical protein
MIVGIRNATIPKPKEDDRGRDRRVAVAAVHAERNARVAPKGQCL